MRLIGLRETNWDARLESPCFHCCCRCSRDDESRARAAVCLCSHDTHSRSQAILCRTVRASE